MNQRFGLKLVIYLFVVIVSQNLVLSDDYNHKVDYTYLTFYIVTGTFILINLIFWPILITWLINRKRRRKARLFIAQLEYAKAMQQLPPPYSQHADSIQKSAFAKY